MAKRWTQLEVDAHNARVLKTPAPTVKAEREIGKGGLHDQIIEECYRRGWLHIHSRTDKRSTIAEGAHDFTIYADRSRVFNIECKAGGGKLTLTQMQWVAGLRRCGHAVHVVWSFEQFLEIIN